MRKVLNESPHPTLYTEFLLKLNINLLVPELFFLILAHSVYKM